MIPYIPDFYTQQEADELFEFIKAQPFVRPPNPRNKTYRLKRLSFPGYSPPQSSRRAGRLFKSPSNYDVSRSVAEAPELYRKFAAKLSEYAGKEINYLSTMGYLTDDHMDFHQHEEDKGREDQTVWVLSLGAVHPVAVRPKGVKDKSQWEIIHPAHGSLYILPSEYNRTHEHAVLEGNDHSYGGLRLAINTKHIRAHFACCAVLHGGPKGECRKPKASPEEAVPGVLSSIGRRDFDAFLGVVAQLVYRFAYRVLDVQDFGVPRDAVHSSLSDIVETGEVPSKYYLSPKACSGVLVRAAGKLSARLEKALKAVAERK